MSNDTYTEVNKVFSKDILDLEKDLIESANLTYNASVDLCRGNHINDNDCSWYHGVWQYLRLFDMVSTPSWHDSFYKQAFKDIRKRTYQPRILISGAADYSMLAYASFKLESGNPIHIVDLCQTPLFACQWFADRHNIKVKTWNMNLFTLPSEVKEKFDVICCDAFLTRFNDSEVHQVLKVWSDLLSQNGEIITTVRLYNAPYTDKNHLLDEYKNRAFKSAKIWEKDLNKNAENISGLAEVYINKMTSIPKGNKEDILRLFSQNGFVVKSACTVDVQGELSPVSYLQIIAVKN